MFMGFRVSRAERELEDAIEVVDVKIAACEGSGDFAEAEHSHHFVVEILGAIERAYGEIDVIDPSDFDLRVPVAHAPPPNGSRPSRAPQADRAAGTAWFHRQRITQLSNSELWHVSFSRLLALKRNTSAG